MHVIADLQLHSRFSRAVSPQMTLPNIAAWAARKGIGLVATGDWTHPIWFREIERDLEEVGSGLLRLKETIEDRKSKVGAEDRGLMIDKANLPSIVHPQPRSSILNHLPSPLFLLATEVSSIYSQGGKLRRVHTLIWVPTIEAARKISSEMTKRGCNLMSDGRPIVGLSCIHIAELVLSIEPKALIIPAHCLLPESMILMNGFFPRQIQDVHVGDRVLTHTGVFRRVTEVKKRAYTGEAITIRPWYFRPGLTTTTEHPYWAIQTLKKCPSTGDICRPSRSHLALCRRKACLAYKPAWMKAEDLQVGDVLVYPRSPVRKPVTTVFMDATKKKDRMIDAGGTRGRVIANILNITPALGRLIGYFLAEGSTDGDNSFSFCFSNKEQEYIDDVVQLVNGAFGIMHHRLHRRKKSKGIEIVFSSKLHAQWLTEQCYGTGLRHNAGNKKVPLCILESEHTVQAECLRGWYRGDHGYTTSRILMNQIKGISLRLGIIPSVIIDTALRHKQRGNHVYKGRIIQANYDTYAISNFSFFEDIYDLKKEFPRSLTKLNRKHGWIDDSYVYLPIKEIESVPYKGNVYNLEVESDHSYVTEFAVVHNCWTPHFSVFGSMSGFDSLDEAFGPYAKFIYAVETGLSSNPAMNWRIKELDDRAILSFSDAHSGPKLGREATVFDLSEISYEHIYQAIRTQTHIAYTIEFYPEEGKYHWSGHRACGIRWRPQETKAKGTTCPVCGKPLTQGVLQRVSELAGRSEEDLELIKTPSGMIMSKTFPARPPFVMLVPLQEIISECIGSPVGSPKVQGPYSALTDTLGGEFAVLLEASIEEITKIAGDRVAQGTDKVRRGDLVIDPGYDGVFGVVKLWKEGEKKALVDGNREQLTMFS